MAVWVFRGVLCGVSAVRTAAADSDARCFGRKASVDSDSTPG